MDPDTLAQAVATATATVTATPPPVTPPGLPSGITIPFEWLEALKAPLGGAVVTAIWNFVRMVFKMDSRVKTLEDLVTQLGSKQARAEAARETAGESDDRGE